MALNRDLMKRRRKDLGLSFAEAGKLAEMSRAQWWNIEAGKQKGLTVESLEHIARALACSPAELLADPPRPPAVKVKKST